MADVEKYEAETRASKDAAVEKLHAERDQAQKQEVDFSRFKNSRA